MKKHQLLKQSLRMPILRMMFGLKLIKFEKANLENAAHSAHKVWEGQVSERWTFSNHYFKFDLIFLHTICWSLCHSCLSILSVYLVPAYMSVCISLFLFICMYCIVVHLSFCTSVCLSVCPHSCMPACQPTCLPSWITAEQYSTGKYFQVCLSNCPSVCMSIFLSACLSAFLPDVWQSVSLYISFSPPVCLSVYMSVCLYVYIVRHARLTDGYQRKAILKLGKTRLQYRTLVENNIRTNVLPHCISIVRFVRTR